MRARAADVVLVFRDVGQQGKIAEGANQLRRLFLGQRMQRSGELVPCILVLIAAESNGELPDVLDAVERIVSMVGANCVAKEAAQLANIPAQQFVFKVIRRLHLDHSIIVVNLHFLPHYLAATKVMSPGIAKSHYDRHELSEQVW